MAPDPCTHPAPPQKSFGRRVDDIYNEIELERQTCQKDVDTAVDCLKCPPIAHKPCAQHAPPQKKVGFVIILVGIAAFCGVYYGFSKL